ncbi:MAG TPA: Fic family protein [Burkholderiales bacterium]|nr:Fic family protein [Burkholderiales bacterium]
MPESGLRHLTTAAVLEIHAEVLRAHGGRPGLRDAALLESAIAAPQATFEGEPLIAEPVDIAAAYLFYLCRNHPFVDGKRTALAACLVFLAANGRLPGERVTTRDSDAWEAFVQDVAGSRLDRLQTVRRLKQLLRGRSARRRR